MNRKLYYKLHNGKNNKALYYFKSFARLCVPKVILHLMLPLKLMMKGSKEEQEAIMKRVNYYCKLSADTDFDRRAFKAKSLTLAEQPMTRQKVYYLDAMQYARFFRQNSRWILEGGDIDYLVPLPSIVKSRPIGGDNQCSVLLNLDKVRHFLFVNDKKTFAEKKDACIFRGRIAQHSGLGDNVKKGRYDFVNKFFGHPMCNVGVIDKDYPKWYSEKLTIAEQLEYKFVMALEGNDVASNLKWIMSSNSVAVMPRPNYETWFMEGTLQPNVHYIEIRPDYSDLIEKLEYYIAHPEKAQAIIANAHAYVNQFRNKKREEKISLLVLERYFKVTNTGIDIPNTY